MSVSNIVKSIQDIMRKDAGVDGDAQRIGQMAWLLFLKIFDSQEEELELIQDDYESPIPSELLWRNWASDKEGITGEGMLKFINDELFPALKSLHASPTSNPRGFVAKEGFSDAFNYMKNGTLLR
jgi:type I restriction enzyme M protein